jgi:hypothetical protein
MFPASGTEFSADQQCIGHQVKEAINDKNFDEVLKGTEKTAWGSIQILQFTNFWADTKRPTTDSSLRQCLKPTERWDAMLLKIHFLHSQLDFSQTVLEDISKEDDENHLQDISTMEKHYEEKWN